jgi:serine phosphatase RsbU (regulator of sigma subunit)
VAFTTAGNPPPTTTGEPPAGDAAGAPAGVAGPAGARSAGGGTFRSTMRGLRLRWTSLLVSVVLLAITAVLTVLAWQVDAHSEQRLLDRQLAQVGTLLSNQAAVIETEMADIGQVAINTNANPNAFARFAAGELRQTNQSLSLWRVGGGHATQLATQGVAPRLPAGGADALAALQPTGKLQVLGVLPGSPDRLAYALMPTSPNTDLVVYAESPLPAGHRLTVPPSSPLAGLDLALYLGTAPDPARLLEATAPTPIGGHTRSVTVPFGTASVTAVGSSPTPLTGPLSSALPWIVLGVGCVLAAAGVATLEYVSRRRAVAERLAVDNERLYRQQRGIAGTLQQALLPVLPVLAGAEVAARYLAGVQDLDVGGDWYDVIERRPGCLAFVVGDVSGRGLPAATTMAGLRFAVRSFLSEGHDIATVLRLLRGQLDVDTDHQFATVLLGELDTGTGRLQLVNAGHFGPVLVTSAGAELVRCPPAPPVGVDTTAPDTATVLHVSGPATLLAYSDGLIERRGEVIDAGLERLRDAAEVATATVDGNRPLERVIDDLLTALTADGGRDDTVLLGVRWTSPTRTPA